MGIHDPAAICHAAEAWGIVRVVMRIAPSILSADFAALGDAIASLLEWTGHAVEREFYVNDAGAQVDKLARSLWARVQQAVGRRADIPEGGYQGDYLVELAHAVLEREGRRFADLAEEEGVRRCRVIGVESQRREQDEDLREFGVRFDVTFSESQLYRDKLIDQTLADLAVVRSHSAPSCSYVQPRAARSASV